MRRTAVPAMLVVVLALVVVVLVVVRPPLGLPVISLPRGSIDTPADGATVSAGGVTITGWAIDQAAGSGTGVDAVQVFIDGQFGGDAIYGGARADIRAGFGKTQFTNSGFLFLLDASTIGGGPHSLEVRAHSTVSNAYAPYARGFVIAGRPSVASRPASIVPNPTRAPRPTSTSAEPANLPKQFGMNSHLTWHNLQQTTIDLDRIQAAGLQSVRFDVLWDKLEPTRKSWSHEYLVQLDAAMAAVASHGLQPLMVMVATPAWARGDAGSAITPPADVQDYADTLGFLAARYATQSDLAFEIWNEPNQPAFWDAPGGPDPLTYARMLKASYVSIKANAPHATVVGGSIAFNDQNFLQGLYAFGDIIGFYDAISLHPYCGAFPPESAGDGYRTYRDAVEQTIKTMATYQQQDKPIWITEVGWSSDDVGDVDRAAYLRRAVSMARGWPQVGQLLVSTEDQADAALDNGLIDQSGNPTITWFAYSLEVSVPNSGSSRVMGALDSPAEFATVRGTLQVAGWAVDFGAPSGPGIDRTQVYLDGAYVAEATYGAPRGDVGSAYAARFTNSGFTYQLNLARVAAGNHTIEVRAHSTVTGANSSYLRPITVVTR